MSNKQKHCMYYQQHRFNINTNLITIIPLFCLLLLTSCQTAANISPTPSQSNRSSIVNEPVATTGCGKAAPTKTGASVRQTIISAGLTRSYLLHLPGGYQVTTPYALVLIFHGHASNAATVEDTSHFSDLADAQSFIAVYPQGSIGPDHRTGWASGGPTDPTVDDVLFVSDLLSRLQATLCVDAYRIYAGGISNGGGMTGLLACKLAKRVAAFAAVAGGFYPIATGCQPGRAVPIMELHGTADQIIKYSGVPRVNLPPIPQWLQGWAARNGCSSAPTVFLKASDVTGEQWTGCKDGSTVTHYIVSSAGHTWFHPTFDPKKGVMVQNVDATMVIWGFFQGHTLA